MVAELLRYGQENAQTARELARYMGCEPREITRQIERERRQGVPICAAVGENPGYYLPADSHELSEYCDRLKGRAIEIFKTRQALVKTLRAIRDKEKQV